MNAGIPVALDAPPRPVVLPSAPPVFPPGAVVVAGSGKDPISLGAVGRQMLRTSYSQDRFLFSQISRYDELGRMVQALGDVQSARMRGEQALATSQSQLAQVESSLRKNRDDQPHMEKRLHRNAHPRFLHYLQLNREEKVHRLTSELEALRQTERRLIEEEQALHATVSHQTAELGRLRENESTSNAASAERVGLFNGVVSSQPPTQNLLQLQFEVSNVHNHRTVESTAVQQVSSALGRVNNALQLFSQAHSCLHRASNVVRYLLSKCYS